MIRTSTLTQKGQATIPKDIREHLRVHPQEKLAFYIEADRVVIEKAHTSLDEVAGALRGRKPKKLPSKAAIQESIAQAAVERDQRSQR